jgi:hypothetical protein
MIQFQKQYDKLVKAYLENKVRPNDGCACFIGNLLNEKDDWTYLSERKPYLLERFKDCFTFQDTFDKVCTDGREKALQCILTESDNTYTPQEIAELEHVFMSKVSKNDAGFWYVTEDMLYDAFEAALLKLKEIHEAKGEIVESYIFKKRELPVVV